MSVAPRWHSRTRGYALMAVMAVMALLVVLVVTAQSSLQFSRQTGRLTLDQIQRMEGAASLEAMYPDPPTTGTVTVDLPGGSQAELSARPLAAEDPLWARLAPLAPRVGDKIVTVKWLHSLRPQPLQYLAGPQRPSFILIPADRESAGEPAGASADSATTRSSGTDAPTSAGLAAP